MQKIIHEVMNIYSDGICLIRNLANSSIDILIKNSKQNYSTIIQVACCQRDETMLDYDAINLECIFKSDFFCCIDGRTISTVQRTILSHAIC